MRKDIRKDKRCASCNVLVMSGRAKYCRPCASDRMEERLREANKRKK